MLKRRFLEMEKRYLNVEELSQYIGVKKSTIYNWVSERRIPFIKCGRLTKFDIKAIDRWMAESEVPSIKY